MLTCRRIRKAVIKCQKRSITRERGERMHSSYNFVILTWEVALLRSAVARRGRLVVFPIMSMPSDCCVVTSIEFAVRQGCLTLAVTRNASRID